MMVSHVDALRRKVERLDTKIHDEMAHASYDDVRIRDMKKQKLHLQEEIHRLNGG